MNGGAEMDAVTHSFKRMGSIGGARPCTAVAEEEWAVRVGFIFKMGNYT